MKLETIHFQVRAQNARRTWSDREAVVVTLEDGGRGEAAPLPGFSPDRLEDCRAALAALGEPFGLDDVGRLPVSLPAARFALETALLVRSGGLLGHLGMPRRDVPRCRLVADLDEAEAALAAGAAVLKVKIGLPGDADFLVALRARFGSVPLRLDANGTLSPSDLGRYARFEPELVEEPIADITRLPRAPFPIALDESLLGGVDLARLAKAGLVHAVVLKPMLLGGALRCLALAREATALGLGVCASHLLDGRVARAATLALAQALPGRVLPCGV